MMLLKTTILVVFLTGCCFTFGKALHCLKCKDVAKCSESCDHEWVNENNLRSAADKLPNLNIDINDIPEPVCMTILLKVNGTVMVHQHCALFGKKLACPLVAVNPMVVNRTDLKLVNCTTCATDNCNVDTIHEVILMPNMFEGMFTTPPPVDQSSHEHVANKTKTTPIPTNNTKPKKSGSNSHYNMIISTYVLACLSLALL